MNGHATTSSFEASGKGSGSRLRNGGGSNRVITPEDKERAAKRKDAGNAAFKGGRHREAISLYTEAIGAFVV